MEDSPKWKGIKELTKSVTFVEMLLQGYNSEECLKSHSLGHAGAIFKPQAGFDVIWCQWCLGHLSDDELITFFERAKSSLNSMEDCLIVVKENLCENGPSNTPRAVFDQQDSSLTR